MIGLLERGLIFALILLGQPGGVGLLIAAKSILRFGAVKDDRALSEYVIIGTLASFAWALLNELCNGCTAEHAATAWNLPAAPRLASKEHPMFRNSRKSRRHPD